MAKYIIRVIKEEPDGTELFCGEEIVINGSDESELSNSLEVVGSIIEEAEME